MRSRRTESSSWRSAPSRFDEIGVPCDLLARCVVLGATKDAFLSANNSTRLARQASAAGILAVGRVLVSALGEVDLPVGTIPRS